MSSTSITVQGVVTADGTLELEGKVPLPAGKVQVILQPVPDLPVGDPFFDMLKGIWATRAKAGLTPRSEEEIKAVRRQLNDDMAEEIAEAMRLQDDCRGARTPVVVPDREAE